MPRAQLHILLALFLTCPTAWGDNSSPNRPESDKPQSSASPSQSSRSSILPGIFRSQFIPEQLAVMGESPSLEQLAGAMSKGQKASALSELSKLEGQTSNPAELEQIAQGYLLLKSPADAAHVAASIQKLGLKNDEAYALLMLNQRRDNASRVKLPSDPFGKKDIVSDEEGLGQEKTFRGSGSVEQADDSHLPIKPVVKIGAYKEPPAFQAPGFVGEGSQNYTSKGAEKASKVTHIWNEIRDLWSYHYADMTHEDEMKLSQLKQSLSETPTGDKMIKELGGWENIEKEVVVKYANIAQASKSAYARQLFDWEKKDPEKKYALVLKSSLKDKPAEEVAPLLAHELRHVGDYNKYPLGQGLAIPSEYAAHRTQVYVFQEMKKKSSPSEIKKIGQDPLWQGQKFNAALWEDKILERYPSAEQFKAQFLGSDYPDRAERAYMDLQRSVVKPGSPQLDYHVKDVYDTLSYETDIVDIVKTRGESGDYSPELMKKDQAVLEQRRVMLGRMNLEDEEYRKKNGFVIGDSKSKNSP